MALSLGSPSPIQVGISGETDCSTAEGQPRRWPSFSCPLAELQMLVGHKGELSQVDTMNRQVWVAEDHPSKALVPNRSGLNRSKTVL